MALLPLSSDTTRTQFAIYSGVAGDDGTVYTVPEGKIFTGYLFGSGNVFSRYIVNGVTYTPSIIKDNAVLPIYLSSGDSISNFSTSYFIMTGYEE